MGEDELLQQPRRRAQQNMRGARRNGPAQSNGNYQRQNHWNNKQWDNRTNDLPTTDETMVHFHKSFGVMQEIFDHRDFTTLGNDILKCSADHTTPGCISIPQFLDLGCAPGGFSACLLQDAFLGPTSVGYGVSLPAELGGFQMLDFHGDRFFVQLADLLRLQKQDLLCADNSVDLCLGDAQYLSCLFKNGQGHSDQQYRGTKVKNKALGIWSLTVKECALAFSKLRHGGSFIFRFGWRGVGQADVHPSGEAVAPDLLARYLQEEEWYKALTHWLFSVLKSLFGKIRPFKSEYVHQADVSFYMVCRGFDRGKYEKHNWEAKLDRAFHQLFVTEDETGMVESIKSSISDEAKAEIDELLDLVGRMRAIGIGSRKVTQPGQWQKKFEEPMKKQELADQAKKEAAKKEADAAKKDTEAAEKEGDAKEQPAQEAPETAEKMNGKGKEQQNGSKEKPNEPDAAAEAVAAAAAPAPAPSDASTMAESASSASSMPQASEKSSKKEPSAVLEASTAPSAKSKAKAKVKPVAKIASQEGSNVSASKRGAQDLSRPGVAAKGVGMRKPPWAAAGSQWSAQAPAPPPPPYGYNGASMAFDAFGNPGYYVMAGQGEVAAMQASGGQVVNNATVAAMHAEEAYRRQMLHFNMAQRQGLLGADAARAQAMQDGSFQGQGHHLQWQGLSQTHQAQLLHEQSLQQQVMHQHQLEGMAPSHGSEWSSNAANGAGFEYITQSYPEQCMVDAGGGSVEAMQPQQVDPWQQQQVDPWSGACLPSQEPGMAPNIVADPTPAVGSSSPADRLAEAFQKANLPAASTPGGAACDLTAVWPSLLSKRKPPAETAVPETTMDAPNEDSDSRGSSDEDYRRRGRRGRDHMHKNRAGRMVRERNNGKRGGGGGRRNGGRQAQSSHDMEDESLLETIKAFFFEIIEYLPTSDLLIQCLRFCLFCAMAWSTNSIIFSVVQLWRGELPDAPGGGDSSAAGGGNTTA